MHNFYRRRYLFLLFLYALARFPSGGCLSLGFGAFLFHCRLFRLGCHFLGCLHGRPFALAGLYRKKPLPSPFLPSSRTNALASRNGSHCADFMALARFGRTRF